MTTWAALAEAAALSAQRAGAAALHCAGRRGVHADLAEGPPSAQALLRTFGARPSDVRVTLYRDTHAWCPYCHKVWVQLEEKRIPYKVEKINMRCYGPKKRSFLAICPGGMLPVLEIDGSGHGVITESSAIMSTIEDYFPDHQPLLPPKQGRHEAERLFGLERQLFGAWLTWLRSDPKGGPSFEKAMDATDAVLGEADGPYFMATFSLVDCVFASTLERIAASVLYFKGLQVKGSGRWLGVDRWFCAMEGRDSYRASQSDFHTHVHDLPPQIGGCLSSGDAAQLTAAAAIDGGDGSWSLPLLPSEGEPPPAGAESDSECDRVEAATAVIAHHANLVASSAVAAGVGGDAGVDAAFRSVVRLLLEPSASEAVRTEMAALGSGGGGTAARALRYTRDRICVPRDMGIMAARQLRAHLNEVAEALDPASRDFPAIPIPSQNRMDVDPTRFGVQKM
jgi:glutathione S-transferase